jgi:hypothetical protein
VTLILLIRRGDVWGFEVFVNHLKQISAALYTPDSRGAAPGSMPFSLCVAPLIISLLNSWSMR